jgi:putative oxidoreductase
MRIDFLIVGALLSFTAAALHIGIILGGPNWYRTFGAGEAMANMAEAGLLKPALITASIAAILTIWGCYALSGAGLIVKLPLLNLALLAITLIYLVRGLAGFLAVFYPNYPVVLQNSSSFWVWSSLVCLSFGVVHLIGLIDRWSSIG